MPNSRNTFMLALAILLLSNAVCWWWAGEGAPKGEQAAKSAMARTLLLTDLALSTESRHTRNISLPEPIAPFQDFPAYHGHFPSSTFMQPPPYIFRISEAPKP